MSVKGKARQTEAESGLDDLLAFLNDLDCGTSSDTPALTHGSISDDEDSPLHGRKLNSSARGTIVSFTSLFGVIRARTGTAYSFDLVDFGKLDRQHVAIGLPVTFTACISRASLSATRLKIDWTEVLCRTFMRSWHGPALPLEHLTVTGKALSWVTGTPNGVVEIGSPRWRTKFNIKQCVRTLDGD